MWWMLASAALGCPGLVDRVEVAVGKSDPPATLVPDVTNRRGDRQIWRNLRASRPAEAVTLTCITRGKQQQVRLPMRVDRCELRDRRVRCQ